VISGFIGGLTQNCFSCITVIISITEGFFLAGGPLIEGSIIGSFVILDGIWVVWNPPYGDEPQGYAIIAIGIFILILTYELVRREAQLREEGA